MSTIIPKTIQAGVNFGATAWRPEFSGGEWEMLLMFRGPMSRDLASTRDDSRHVWHVPGAETAAWVPGDYAYTIRATNGSDVIEVESGRVRITPDIAAAAAGYDGRSPNRIALEAIDAVMAKRATMDQERYRINNRELYRTPVADLIRLRAFYFEQVQREENRASGRGRFSRQVKFTVGPWR